MKSVKLHANHYKQHLYPNEEVLLVTERHSIKRLPMHIVFVLFAVGMAVVIFGGLYNLEIFNTVYWVLGAFWIMCLVCLYFLAWNLLLERRGLVFTDQRLMIFEHDAFSRSHRIIPYERIEEATVKENFFGHIFGYGDVRLVIHEEDAASVFKGYTGLLALEGIISKYIGPRTREGFPTWKL